MWTWFYKLASPPYVYGVAAAFTPWLLGLAVIAIGYSVRLKEVPLADVFVLAALYTIRLCAGSEATGHRLSLWLLAVTVCVAVIVTKPLRWSII